MGKNVAQLLVEDFVELSGGVKDEQKTGQRDTQKVIEDL